jgi:hypothetical protein
MPRILSASPASKLFIGPVWAGLSTICRMHHAVDLVVDAVSWVPVDLATMSTRCIGLPISRHSDGSRSGTSCGGSMPAAITASSV